MAQVERKTIVDILLEQNRLTPSEAMRFNKTLSNSQIEIELKKDNLVSPEDIAKAYAVIYSLPFIRLENYQISQEAYQVIPVELIHKYKIIAFDRTQDRLKIAIANPSELKSNPPEVLENLRQKKGLAIDLYITTPEDITTVVEKFNVHPAYIEMHEEPNLPKPDFSKLKNADLQNFKIPFEIISKFPLEISKKYRMVVFDAPQPNLIRVAVSDPSDAKVREILDFVKEKNHINIEEFVAPPQDIIEAIRLYYQKPVVPTAPPQESPPPTPVNQSHVAPQKPAPYAVPPHAYAPSQPKSPATTQEKPHFERRPEQQNQQELQEDEKEFLNITPETNLDSFLGRDVNSVEILQQIAQTGNIPFILAATVALAVRKKASDIHIEPEEKELRVRYRVDGVLKDVINLPLEMHPAILSRIKILSRLKIDEQRIPQDGRFDVVTANHQIDLRVSTLPTVRGEKAALRILDKSVNIYTLDELGIAGRNLKILEENISKPFGVILATGPTGSGKSTTLYSILKKIASPQVNVITLEDPVEYEIPGINQCQVKPKIGFSFAEGLRSVLRQDPNIIMVGEIRDSETAGMATHAALTGHLVLSTLHTNDAAGALPRLINMGVEPFLITSSMNCIIGQRLVRKICPKCKTETPIPQELVSEIEKELASFNLPKPYKFYQGKGCSECNQGFSGRVGIYEVLAMSDKIESLAIQKRPASEILHQAVEEGMVTMKQDGLIKAIKGVTTVSEVLRVTSSG
jgi:type II secretory ATPase GspE/PulE/Tfp pilus assembly ATPase PilB-like protein